MTRFGRTRSAAKGKRGGLVWIFVACAGIILLITNRWRGTPTTTNTPEVAQRKESTKPTPSSSTATQRRHSNTAARSMDLLLPKDESYSKFRSECIESVSSMVDAHIEVLALDFDLTIVDTHTGGHWDTKQDDAHGKLWARVRPEMKCLIQASLLSNVMRSTGSLRVAVASFSRQTDVIEEIMNHIRSDLEVSLKDNEDFPDNVMTRIPTMIIRGGDNYSDPDGKKKQLSEIEEEIKAGADEKSTVIPSSAILLVDDDENNIKRAKDDGYSAVWMNPKHPSRIFSELKAVKRDS